ncbi:MAG: ATPase, partial [Cyanothece sp. SIO1E1]|nr:ATPase [Cyanothece sp. SIO1E1]
QMIRAEIDDLQRDVNQEIKVKHTQVENELQAINETYFALEKTDQQFEGVLVNIQQFRQLDTEEFKVTNLYDEGYQLVNRLKAKKAKDQYALIVRYNDVDHVYPLRTQKTEQVAYIYKKPHRIVAEFWDGRHKDLLQYIEKQFEKIDNELPASWQHLGRNLFVKPEYAKIVQANLEEVRAELEQLKLRLEKIHFSYSSL